MPQTSYGIDGGKRDFLQPGDLYDGSRLIDNLTLINSDPQAAQVSTVVVDTAANATVYSFSINGVPVSYTSDASATKLEIVEGLRLALQNEPSITRIRSESDGVDTITLYGTEEGYAFTLADSDANLTTATTTAAASASVVPFGRGLVRTGDREGRLPKASDFGGSQVTFDITADDSQPYSFGVVYGGAEYEVSYTSDASATTAEISAGLKAALDALSLPITATEPTDQLVLTGDDGAVFQIADVSAGGAGALDLTVNSQGGKPPYVLIALRSDRFDDSQTELDAYPPNSAMAGERKRRCYVDCEAEVTSLSQDVYMRVAVNGSLDQLGSFRGSADDGCVNLTELYGWSWHKLIDGDRAVVQPH